MTQFRYAHLLTQRPQSDTPVDLNGETISHFMRSKLGSDLTGFPRSLPDQIDVLFTFCGIDTANRKNPNNAEKINNIRKEFGYVIDSLLWAQRSGTRYQNFHREDNNAIEYEGNSQYRQISMRSLDKFVTYVVDQAGKRIAESGDTEVTPGKMAALLASDATREKILEETRERDKIKRIEKIQALIDTITVHDANIDHFCREFRDALPSAAKERLGSGIFENMRNEIKKILTKDGYGHTVLKRLNEALERHDDTKIPQIKFVDELKMGEFFKDYVFAAHLKDDATKKSRFAPSVKLSVLADPEARKKAAQDIAAEAAAQLEKYGKTENAKEGFFEKIKDKGLVDDAYDIPLFNKYVPDITFEELNKRAIQNLSARNLRPEDLSVNFYTIIKYSDILLKEMVAEFEAVVKARKTPAADRSPEIAATSDAGVNPPPSVPSISLRKNPAVHIAYRDESEGRFTLTVSDGASSQERMVQLLPNMGIADFLESLQTRAGRLKPERLNPATVLELVNQIPQRTGRETAVGM